MVRTKCLKVIIRYKDSRQSTNAYLELTTLGQNLASCQSHSDFLSQPGVLSVCQVLVMLCFVALWILTIRFPQHHNLYHKL